jgi:decaprenylphospho-beta-D-erythro-pentofuranosid-2-ulose 2-reductase
MPRSGQRVLVVGATSAIAQETSRLFAAYGAHLFLTGRDPDKLASVEQDLRLRGAAQVDTAILDVADLTRHGAVIDAAFAALGDVDVALIAHGVLPDQAHCEEDAGAALETLTVNFTATVALLTPLANRLEAQRRGCLAVISSVAGDRGRQSNYVYGASKGGLDRFLQGLRNRLYRSGVTVLTIKPGFVDTPMTASIPKSALFASPARVAHGIHRAIESRRNVVYLPWFWRPIMWVVNGIPESIFKRLRL